MTFTCASTLQYRFIGFVYASYQTSGTYSDSFNSMAYAFGCGGDSNMHVIEGGSNKGNFGTYTSTSALEIRLHPNGVVDYVKDGSVSYTSEIANTQWPLYVGVSLFHEASPSISNIEYAAL